MSQTRAFCRQPVFMYENMEYACFLNVWIVFLYCFHTEHLNLGNKFGIMIRPSGWCAPDSERAVFDRVYIYLCGLFFLVILGECQQNFMEFIYEMGHCEKVSWPIFNEWYYRPENVNDLIYHLNQFYFSAQKNILCRVDEIDGTAWY